MSGPPGSGKTLLARSLPSILPRMTPTEALDVTRIYSVAGMLPGDVLLIRHRPFRAPHHTILHAGLVGGGQWPRPGETRTCGGAGVSLAHRGVLFLDEMPEFGQHGLEVLRQPLEDKIVTISRAQGSLTFPANFMLVGAQNPCPCGYWGDPEHTCSCSPMVISRYQKRLSGPLLDRIDIHVEVPRVPFQKLSDERRGEPSAAIRGRVEAARARQSARFADGGRGGVTSPIPLTTNADMGPTQVRDHCPVDETGRQLLGAAMQRLRPGDEPECAGVSPGAEAGADDCGPGGVGADPAGAYRGGDSVSAETDGITLRGAVSKA
jgi:magnesium chelatase family protein